jgi:probable phosphoglycerate mutase
VNDVGQAEARQVAKQIAAGLRGPLTPGLTVLTSPLRRAVATAVVVAAALGTVPRITEALIEVDFGAADGLTWDELAAAYPLVAGAAVGRRDVDWPGGETAHEVRARANVAARQLLDAAVHGPVVAVAHGRILAAILQLIDVSSNPPELAPGTAVRLDPVVAR